MLYKNIMLTTMNLLYLLYFVLKTYSILMAKSSRNIIQDSKWEDHNFTNSDDQILNTIYWLNGGEMLIFYILNCSKFWLRIFLKTLFLKDRFYYDSLDPLIVADCLFAIANLLSIFRIFFLLPVNQSLGPLQISLKNMLSARFSY